MKGFNTLCLTKSCDICGRKEVTYKVWLPNWKKFIFACPACTRDFNREEDFADAYELGNLKFVK